MAVDKRRVVYEQEIVDTVCNAYARGESTDSIAEWVGFGRWKVLNILKRSGISTRRRTHELNESAFESPVGEAAYWAGFIMADGSVTQGNGGSWTVSVAQAGDGGRDHLLKFQKFLGTTSNVRAVTSSGYASTQQQFRICVHSQELARSLMKLGIVPRKSKVAVANETVVANRDFWRGMVDGDGYVRWETFQGRQNRMPQIGLVGSRDLVNQFRKFCNHFCPECRAKASPMHSIWKWNTTGSTAYKVIRNLYTENDVALERKQSVAKEILSSFELKDNYRNRHGNNQYKRAI